MHCEFISRSQLTNWQSTDGTVLVFWCTKQKKVTLGWMDEDDHKMSNVFRFTYAKVFDNVYFRATLHPPSNKSETPMDDKSFYIICSRSGEKEERNSKNNMLQRRRRLRCFSV